MAIGVGEYSTEALVGMVVPYVEPLSAGISERTRRTHAIGAGAYLVELALGDWDIGSDSSFSTKQRFQDHLSELLSRIIANAQRQDVHLTIEVPGQLNLRAGELPANITLER